MIATVASFPVDTALDTDGETFTGSIPPAWSAWGGPVGAFLGGLLARAACTGTERVLRSISIAFLRPAKLGDVRIRHDTMFAGRSVTIKDLLLEQEDAPVASARATLASGDEGPRLVTGARPIVPHHDDCPSFDDLPPASIPAFAEQAEIRWAGGARPFSAAEGPMQVWMRMKRRCPVDAPLLVYLTDAWLPATYSRVDRPMALPSIDLTVHLPHTGPTKSPWLLCTYHAITMAEGYAVERSEIHAEEGHLLGLATQLRRHIPKDRSTGVTVPDLDEERRRYAGFLPEL